MSSSGLKVVTLTGADDSLGEHGPSEMLKLSEEFPFVEWGILIGSKPGRSRFPGLAFFERLHEAWAHRLESETEFRLSLHLCGSILDTVKRGRLLLPTWVPWGIFRRVQLNWHAEELSSVEWVNTLKALAELGAASYQGLFEEAIFQVDGVNDLDFESFDPNGEPRMIRPRLSGLFDTSHGAGRLPGGGWRKPIDGHKWCGYAGGLGPMNIAEELPKIQAAAGDVPFWVDMETRLYDGRDQFDLGRCRAVLEACRPFVEGA